jgi:hypothetical protein
MKKTAHFFFVLTLAIYPSGFLFSSCAIRSTAPPSEDQTIHWEGKSSKEVLDQLQLEQKRIADFTTGFSIVLDPPPKGQPSSLQGVLFYARDKIRIKSITAFGRVMFDLVMKGDIIQIYIPSRQTIYSGKMENEKGNPWQEVFNSMFANVAHMTVKKDTDLIIKNESVILPLTGGVFHLDRKTGFVKKWVQKQRVIYYENYISSSGHPPFPTRIFVRSMDNLKKATCVFNQVQINKGIDHVFNLSDYHPKLKRDISELKR